jgi:hypothetical protein
MARSQKTPKGAEIPIPKRGDMFGNLKKAAKPEKPSRRYENFARGLWRSL